jgi:Mn2+/Fe2+ NRAMP family transporter
LWSFRPAYHSWSARAPRGWRTVDRRREGNKKPAQRRLALFWSAVINGVVAHPLMVMLMIMSANAVIVKEFSLPVYLPIVGWAATVGMLLATLAFIASSIRGLF